MIIINYNNFISVRFNFDEKRNTLCVKNNLTETDKFSEKNLTEREGKDSLFNGN